MGDDDNGDKDLLKIRAQMEKIRLGLPLPQRQSAELTPTPSPDQIAESTSLLQVLLAQAKFIKANLVEEKITKKIKESLNVDISRTSRVSHRPLSVPPLSFAELAPEDRVEISDLASAPNQVLYSKYLLCRSMSAASMRVALEVVVTDPAGQHGARLALYNYSGWPWVQKSVAQINFDDILPPGMFLVVKNPWFKSTKGMLQIRVDNPAEVELISKKKMDTKFPDLVWDSSNSLFKAFNKANYWAALEGVGDDATFDKLKWMGHNSFTDQRYTDAIRYYDICIDYAKNPENKAKMYSNKAAALLELGCWNAALNCAESALALFPENDKYMYRKTKALIGNRKYATALNFLEEKVATYPILLEKTEFARMLDSVTCYNQRKNLGPTSSQLFALTQDTLENYDALCEFTGPMLISHSKGKGIGVFATEDIHPGQLLVCAKAFAYHASRAAANTHTSPSVANANISSFLNYDHLVGKLANKLHFDPELGPVLYTLGAGPACDFLTSDDPAARHVDMKRIYDVVRTNGFGCVEAMKVGGPEMKGVAGHCLGLWLCLSPFNHSCSEANAIWYLCGEVAIVKAIAEVKKGEELLIPYTTPNRPYEERMKELGKNYDFICTCKLCELDRAEPESVVNERKKALKSLASLSVSSSSGELKKAVKYVEKLHSLRKDKNKILLNFPLLAPQVSAVCETLFKKHRLEELKTICLRMWHVASNSLFWQEHGINVGTFLITYNCIKGDKAELEKWVDITKGLVMKLHGNLDIMGPILAMVNVKLGIDYFGDKDEETKF